MSRARDRHASAAAAVPRSGRDTDRRPVAKGKGGRSGGTRNGRRDEATRSAPTKYRIQSVPLPLRETSPDPQVCRTEQDVRMIPPVAVATDSAAEKKVFALLEATDLGPHARAIHSLNISEHEY